MKVKAFENSQKTVTVGEISGCLGLDAPQNPTTRFGWHFAKAF